MSRPLFSVHFIILLSSCLSLLAHNLLGSALATGNDTDQRALLQFKAKITSDPLGVTQTWNNTIHFCEWHGVTCGSKRHHQRVTELRLPSLKLAGSISPYIVNLSFLMVLQLDNNSFSHQIPREIGHLRRLQVLQIRNNTITGEIPSNLSSCSKLRTIHLYGNKLGGEIPSELGLLSNLERMNLTDNQLIGSIPPSLGNLSSLRDLRLAKNSLSGVIPQVLGQLKNLSIFSLGYNLGISGTIPASIFNLSNIRMIDFGFNQIEGSLPSNLGFTMPYIEFLSVAVNNLTGPFPISLLNASNLKQLQLLENHLSGSLPPSLGMLDKLSQFSIAGNHFGSAQPTDLNFFCSLTNATGLTVLQIASNNLGGELPECLSNFSSKLRTLNFQSNQIFGKIPSGIGNLINLNKFAASVNQLSGSTPLGIGRLQKVAFFLLSNNFLSGTIPSSVGNMTMLSKFSINNNNFQGKIPSSLGNCNNLIKLNLANNKLSGPIPPQVIGLSSLSVALDLSSNFLSGQLPTEVGNLIHLDMLDVSNNRLSGVLPNSIGSCVMLEMLFLQQNSFRGPIPSSLPSLRSLMALDIASNNFSGEIPEFMARFRSLQYLNLSYNDFEGAIPVEGVFFNASATFLQGNHKLCGGISKFHFPNCNLKASTKGSNISLKLKIGIALGGLGVILALSFFLIFWFTKKKEQPSETYAENSLLNLSYQSLLKATNGFSSANLVGSGSFGSVYKGILEESGVAIAVKVLNVLSHGASRSFMAECEALRNVRHRNLVKVLTACSSIDYQGNDFKAIVYEFMVNGSLEDWLHPLVATDEAGGEAKVLKFDQRLNVAIDIGYALEYLHHHCETTIVHCDLKPNNVLLDDEMVGHVGDFGLAKFIASDIQDNTSSSSSSLGLRGTIGYAPPEYGMGCVVTTYGDVHSYGILLLEMFTGKRPTDEMFKENLNLHNLVKTALPNRIAEIIDPILLKESFKGQAMINIICSENRQNYNKLVPCLNSIFEVGVACSAELPNERMNMTDVVAKLCSIRDQLFPTPPSNSRVRG